MTVALRPLHVGKFVPPPYAGVEAHIDTLLTALQPEAEPTLVAGESGADTTSVPPTPYRVLTAPSLGRLASVTLSPGVLSLTRRELASGRCNLLHVHTPNPWGDAAVLTCPRSVPTVMTWHSDIVRQRRMMLAYQYVQRAALQRVDKVVVFTPKHYDSSRQLHQLHLANKIVQIPIGIDFDRLDARYGNPVLRQQIADFAQGRPVLLSVGRQVYYKGYDYLLQAFAQVRAEAVLVLIGHGAMSAQLRQMAQDLGVAQRVLFLGEVDQASLIAAFHACDVFTLPSVEPSEAFGIASAEAMSCGKPTLVCELGNGVNYLNQAGRTSLVTPPRDVPALADAIQTLVRDAALRQRMGQEASRWVRAEFSIQTMRDKTLALYRSLL